MLTAQCCKCKSFSEHDFLGLGLIRFCNHEKAGYTKDADAPLLDDEPCIYFEIDEYEKYKENEEWN